MARCRADRRPHRAERIPPVPARAAVRARPAAAGAAARRESRRPRRAPARRRRLARRRRRRRRARGARQREVLLGMLLDHPVPGRTRSHEEIAALDFPEPELDRLRRAILEVDAAHPGLDAAGACVNTLGQSGFATTVDAVLVGHSVDHAGFAAAGCRCRSGPAGLDARDRHAVGDGARSEIGRARAMPCATTCHRRDLGAVQPALQASGRRRTTSCYGGRVRVTPAGAKVDARRR